jgi:hypothetical protein
MTLFPPQNRADGRTPHLGLLAGSLTDSGVTYNWATIDNAIGAIDAAVEALGGGGGGGDWTDDPTNQILKTTNTRHLQMANNRTLYFGDPLVTDAVVGRLQPSGTSLVVRGEATLQLRNGLGTTVTISDIGVSIPNIILDPFITPANQEGEIAYQNGHFMGYNGTAWVQLD